MPSAHASAVILFWCAIVSAFCALLCTIPVVTRMSFPVVKSLRYVLPAASIAFGLFGLFALHRINAPVSARYPPILSAPQPKTDLVPPTSRVMPSPSHERKRSDAPVIAKQSGTGNSQNVIGSESIISATECGAVVLGNNNTNNLNCGAVDRKLSSTQMAALDKQLGAPDPNFLGILSGASDGETARFIRQLQSIFQEKGWRFTPAVSWTKLGGPIGVGIAILVPPTLKDSPPAGAVHLHNVLKAAGIASDFEEALVVLNEQYALQIGAKAD